MTDFDSPPGMNDRMQYFGEKWDAPMTDDADPIPTPTDEVCMTCMEHFREGDQGLRYLSGFYQHKECGMRVAMGGIGHVVDHDRYCKGELGTDAGLSTRNSALLVWDWFVNGSRYTADHVEVIRQVKDNPDDYLDAP